jgi:drug/metabolite transporter (DMT)-like permease
MPTQGDMSGTNSAAVMGGGGLRAGTGYALASVLAMGVLDVANRAAVAVFQANPWGLAFFQILFGGVFLLLVAGVGREGLATLRSPLTWVVGFTRVLHLLAYVFALSLLSATEVGFLGKLSGLLALVLAFLVFRRVPGRGEWPGVAVMALAWLLLATQPGIPAAAVLFVAVAALTSAVESVVLELHPELGRALGFRAVCRMTGAVMVATSLTLIAAMAGLRLMEVGEVVSGLPPLDGFFSPRTLACGLVVGALVRTLYMITMFLTIRSARAEVFLLFATLAPFVTLAAEALLARLLPLPLGTLDAFDALCGALLAAGAAWIVLARLRAERPAVPAAVEGAGCA